jgi:hypothetical protein
MRLITLIDGKLANVHRQAAAELTGNPAVAGENAWGVWRMTEKVSGACDHPSSCHRVARHEECL